MIHPDYIYLFAATLFLIPWVAFFALRQDLRKGMLVVSLFIGVLSVVTAHYWWTIDWWRPATITGTTVGIEDFLSGFATGGLMTFAYEVIFRKKLYRARSTRKNGPSHITLLLLLALLTAWLFWGVGFTSFWSSLIAMAIVTGIIFFYRKDLVWAGVASGILMALVSLPIYLITIAFAPLWVQDTYLLEKLSGVLVIGIPIEELVFWFMAGLLFGPFYEYWQGLRTRNMTVRDKIRTS